MLVKKIKRILILATGIILTLLGFYLGFRNIPVNSILKVLSQFNLFWVLPAVFFSLLSFIIRAFRWQLILKPSVKLNFFNAFHPLMAGFMVNCIFPARVGELVRPMALLKEHRLPFSTGLSAVAVERVFDMICMLFFLAVVMTSVAIPPDTAYQFGSYTLDRNMLNQLGLGMIQLSCIVLIIIGLLCVNSIKQFFYNLILKIPGLFIFAGPTFQQWIKHILENFVLRGLENLSKGFLLLKNFNHILICLGLSFGVWIVQAAAWYAMLFGFDGLGLNFFEISTVMILVCFFIALPSVPGYWGLWEVAGIYAMQLFGTPKELSASYTLVNHAVQVFTMIGVGSVSAFLCGINIRRIFDFQ